MPYPSKNFEPKKERSMGSLKVVANSTNTNLTRYVYVDPNSTLQAVKLVDFEHGGGTILRYIGDVEKDFIFTGHFATEAEGHNYWTGIKVLRYNAQDGSFDTIYEEYNQAVGGGNNRYAGTQHVTDVITMKPNDYIKVQIANLTASGFDITLWRTTNFMLREY